MPSIGELTQKVLDGGHLDYEECRWVLDREGSEALELAHAAAKIREHFCGDDVSLCSLVNAKRGGCAEDCSYCSQSARYNTGVPTEDVMDPAEILTVAKAAEQEGARHFCIVMTGRGPGDKELEVAIAATRLIHAETSLEVTCSLGILTSEQAHQLAESGVDSFNHNLETAPSWYDKVKTTHSFQERLETVQAVRQAGMSVCSGGIIGMGESRKERAELAMELQAIQPECVPVNMLNPRPGTPLEDIPPLEPMEIVKTIAMLRFMLPHAVITLAGGRERALRDLQSMGLLSGANGLIIGNYLTTLGRDPKHDRQMIADLGMEVATSTVEPSTVELSQTSGNN